MHRFRTVVIVSAALALASGCARRVAYDNPIDSDSLQPDKLLFDKAIEDIEKSRFQTARLTLQTLMNTYDTSEYLAKSKLAIADSWMREGGTHALAQAEAEYKDFILFYPTMEESAEAQMKICRIHYRQMEKPDRDPGQALRTEDECRNLVLQFPNSRFVPEVEQMLRDAQQVLADGEFRVGEFYYKKGSYPSAANRLDAMVNQYPLYSGADLALWLSGNAYARLGTRFRNNAVESYQRIVRDYPLSRYADGAKAELASLEAEVPEADPVAQARMEYELENRADPGMWSHMFGIFRTTPDVSLAAKSGEPSMARAAPAVPVSVPTPEQIAAQQAAGAQIPTADVGAEVITGPSALDTQPDARRNQQQQQQQQGQPQPQQ
jgi:outer membrane protein assembly factor BamD